MFELKPLSPAAIPGALLKAERYRLLNEPDEAQSICEDVLAADPDNSKRVRTLILAITDSFPQHDAPQASRAQELVARLPSSTSAPTTPAWWPNGARARCCAQRSGPRAPGRRPAARGDAGLRTRRVREAAR